MNGAQSTWRRSRPKVSGLERAGPWCLFSRSLPRETVGRSARSSYIQYIHTYIQEDLKQLRLLVEKVVSCREAPRNLGVPSEEIALLQELADVKEEQLRAAAAAEAAEAARLAQLAAQKPGELSAN